MSTQLNCIKKENRILGDVISIVFLLICFSLLVEDGTIFYPNTFSPWEDIYIFTLFVSFFFSLSVCVVSLLGVEKDVWLGRLASWCHGIDTSPCESGNQPDISLPPPLIPFHNSSSVFYTPSFHEILSALFWSCLCLHLLHTYNYIFQV